LKMYLPVALVVVSNIFYHICSKQTPGNVNPLASLTVTYVVAAIAAVILYFVFNRGANLVHEYGNINWTSFVLGIAIVGLECGYMYMYKLGWNLNSGQVFASSILAVALLIIGAVVFHEVITAKKIIGFCLCLVGLYFINKS